jgi:hypothetical protein
LRKAFIDFTSSALGIFSHSYFKESGLLKDLMLMGKDLTPSIRIRFLQRALPALNDTLAYTDSTNVLELIQILDLSKHDSNREVSDIAYEIDDTI